MEIAFTVGSFNFRIWRYTYYYFFFDIGNGETKWHFIDTPNQKFNRLTEDQNNEMWETGLG